MPEPRPTSPIVTAGLAFLVAALVVDVALFAMTWLAPDLWFEWLHPATRSSLRGLGRSIAPGNDLAITFLRRAGGHWAAFAIGQALALALWRRQPIWLVLVAGMRLSDVLTDVSYVVAAPSLTGLGYALLLPPPVFNLVGTGVLLKMHAEVTRG